MVKGFASLNSAVLIIPAFLEGVKNNMLMEAEADIRKVVFGSSRPIFEHSMGSSKSVGFCTKL